MERDWIDRLGVLAGLSGLAAAVLYGMFNLLLRYFYGFMNVDPREVGWDLPSVLAQFLPAYLLALVPLWAWWFLFVADIDWKPFRWLRGHPVRSAVLAGLLVFGALFGLATDRALAVLRGEPIGRFIDSLVPVAARCVDVEWVGGSQGPPAGLTEPAEFLHLGGADGTVVLYDHVGDRPLRVAAENVLLTGC